MSESTNDTAADGEGALPLLEGAFRGRDAFTQLIRDGLAAASREGWRELILCDSSFEDWPLGERAVSESLNAWSQSGRKCILLARRWDTVLRKHARFVKWRQTWGHIIDARAVPSADAVEFPSAIWTPAWVMQRLDPERSNGVAGREPRRRLLLRESINEWLLKSSPSFPSSTLGL